MSIPGIEAIGSSFMDQMGGIAPTLAAQPAATGYATPQVTEAQSSAFGSVLSDAVNNLQDKQNYSNQLAVQAVTGDLDDVHDYTIASSEAKVTLELTAAVRNKAVDAFNEILRMQV